jgi:hypothetical protein
MPRVLSIDIGFHNLGLVLASWSRKNEPLEVEIAKKISLEDYKYIAPSNEIAHLVPLFVDAHKILFQSADVILIERQPPGGFTNIQTLLHYMFIDKVILVNPVSMHTHFGMGHLNYEQRKERVESIASRYVTIEEERKHDIADALCMILYYKFKTDVHIFDRFRFRL